MLVVAVSPSAPHGADDNVESRTIRSRGREHRQTNGSSGSGIDGLIVLTGARRGDDCLQAVTALRGGFCSVWLATNPSIPILSLLIKNQVQAELTLTCPQQAGRRGNKWVLPAETWKKDQGMVGWAGWAGWGCWLLAAGLLGCWAALSTPTRPGQGQGRGHWHAGRTTSGATQPHIPQIVIMGRSACARQRYEVSCGVIPVPRRSPRYWPIGGVLVAGCQAVSALSDANQPFDGSVLVAVFRNLTQPLPPSPSTVFSSISSFSICCVTTHYYG